MRAKKNLSYLLKAPVFCLLLTLFTVMSAAARAEPIIAVASNLRLVIEEVAQGFYRQTGLSVRFSFGSSGNLARQIIQGAPFEMFMSADEGYVFRVAGAGAGIDRGKIYAYGRIALFAPKGSPLQNAQFPGGYADVFAGHQDMRFALANPQLAPYGRAAKEALENAGLWQTIQPRLIYGENISQTAQFILSGSTLGGIIAYAQALAPPFKDSGEYTLIAESRHMPIAQRMVLLKRAGETARRFYGYIGGKQALQIFRKYGYTAS